MWSFRATGNFSGRGETLRRKNGVRRRSASRLLLEFAVSAEPFATTSEVLALETSMEAMNAAIFDVRL